MPTTSATRIAGASLILGAALNTIAVFLRPGSILIEPLAHDARLLERVQVLANNPTLTHVTTLVSVLGLFLLLFGFLKIQRALDHDSARDAYIRFGILLLVFAVFTLSAANSLNHMIAHIVNHGETRGASQVTLYTLAVDVQAVKAGIVIIAGYARLLGLALIGMGLYLRFGAGMHGYLAAAAGVVSVAALVVLGIGDHFHDLTAFYRMAVYAIIPLNLWAIALGYALYKGHPSLTEGSSE